MPSGVETSSMGFAQDHVLQVGYSAAPPPSTSTTPDDRRDERRAHLVAARPQERHRDQGRGAEGKHRGENQESDHATSSVSEASSA